MPKADDLFTARKGLDEICHVPDRIISVYSLEKHVWADSHAGAARKARRPELQTIEEFQIDPVRPFLNDILRGMAAPYKLEQRENPIGQGYWIQAEFGSGKSHLLCFLSALALGSREAWRLVQEKEQKAGRGKRDSLFRFWEEGLEAKSGKGKRGIFVIVRTLVGTGSGTVGLADKGRRLTEYILDAAKEQLEIETGRNISLYRQNCWPTVSSRRTWSATGANSGSSCVIHASSPRMSSRMSMASFGISSRTNRPSTSAAAAISCGGFTPSTSRFSRSSQPSQRRCSSTWWRRSWPKGTTAYCWCWTKSPSS